MIVTTRRANFEVWDHRPGSHHGPECVSRYHALDEAERACRDAAGDPRLLTIYDSMDRVRGMYRDGKPVTDEMAAASWE